MKNIYLITLLLFSSSLFAQNDEIKSLLETCIKDAVPNDFKYFNLVDSSFIMKLDEYSLNYIDDKKFLNDYKDFELLDFLKGLKSTKKLNWKSFNLPNAKIYSIDSIPKFSENLRSNVIVIDESNSEIVIDFINHRQLRLLTGKSNTEKEIDEAIKSAWANFDKTISKENKVYFKFSTPILSDDKKYAIIQINNSGSGKYYIYKKEKKSWVKIYTFGYWVG
jgi:hypothetical protein